MSKRPKNSPLSLHPNSSSTEVPFIFDSPSHEPILGGINDESQDLVLPQYYTDQDFARLLDHAITSPGLLTWDPIAKVLPTPLVALGTPTPLQYRTELQSITEDEILAYEAEGPLAEETSESTALPLLNIEGINDSQGELSPVGENMIWEQPEDLEEPEEEIQRGPNITKYERAQDKQLDVLRSTVVPLLLVIGTSRSEMCTACFHLGHHFTDLSTCPAGRISSLFSEERESFYDRFAEKTTAYRLLMKDIAWCCQGLSWAIQGICRGQLKEFQIFPSTVSLLRVLLGNWKTVCQDEKFQFGKFGECAGELVFGEPINVTLIQGDTGPYRQSISKTSIPVSKKPNEYQQSISEIGIPPSRDPKKLKEPKEPKKPKEPKGLGGSSVVPSLASNVIHDTKHLFSLQLSQMQAAKQKTECDADRLQFEIIGNRRAAVCPNCLYRGHAKNSVKICPYLIVSMALNKVKSGRKKVNSVLQELKLLTHVVNNMKGLDELPRVEPIISLLAAWEDAIANLSKSKRNRLVPSKLQDTNTLINLEDEDEPAVLPNNPQTLSPDNPLMLPDYSFLTPIYEEDGISNHSRSIGGFIETSTPGLNSPFSRDGNLPFYNAPLGHENLSSSLFPLQGFAKHSEDFQHRNNELVQNADYSLEEFINSEMINEEGIQATFADFDMTMLDNYQSPPINDYRQPSEINSRYQPGETTADNLLAFSNYPRQDFTNSTGIITGQSIQPTYSSTSLNQQNIPDYESDRHDPEHNFFDDELPAEIFWRTRCPLKLVGNRGDNFCKICLHYGHDRRSQSCLVNVVRTAIAANKLTEMLAVSETIKDLEAGSRWQMCLPKAMQTDDGMILNLIRRWKEAVENLEREAKKYSEASFDFRDFKHHHPLDSPTLVHGQQTLRRSTDIQYPMQADHETRHIAPNSPRPAEGQPSEAPQSLSPRRNAPERHRMQNQMQSQQSLNSPLPFPKKDSFNQLSQDQSPYRQQEPPATPKGWAIDYSTMDSNLFAQISDYIITDGDPADGDKLRVNHHKMPPMLIIAIRKYVLPESNTQRAPTQQLAMHQQNHPPQQDYPQLQRFSPSMQLLDVGKRYNDQTQMLDRRRD